MKKYFIIMIIPTLYSSVVSMDFDRENNFNSQSLSLSLQNIAPDTPYEQKIRIISARLNNTIPQGIFFEKSPSDLTEKEYLNLIKIVQDNDKEITHPFLIDLMKENKYFKAAIDYCIKLAHTNLSKVTTSTLDIVIDSEKQQPTAALNRLCKPLKKYLMDYAWGEIKHYYTMTFVHTNRVSCIDIHEKSHRAASISCDGICKLWDIAMGKKLYTLLCNNCRYIKFNQNGSLLATIEETVKFESKIKIWHITESKPESPQHIVNHTVDEYIHKLVFFEKHIAVFHEKDMTQYKLRKNGTVTNLGWTRCKCIQNSKTHNSTIDKNSWSLTQSSPYLYLCKQAATNTILKEALPSITKTTPYQRLTPYEQDLVKEDIKAKRGLKFDS